MLAVVLLSVPAAAAGAPARAPEDRVFSLSPAVVPMDAEAGSPVSFRATVSNQTLVPLQVDSFVVDMEPAAGGDGKALVPAGESELGAATWATVEPAGFVMQPGTERQLRVQFAVPAGIASGGYYAALQAEASPVRPTGTLEVRPRLTTLALLTVRGELRHDLRVAVRPRRRFLWSAPTRWTATLENRGNVHELVAYRMQADGILGARERSRERSAILLPGSRRSFDFSLDVRDAPDLLRGRLNYALAVDGNAGARGEDRRSRAAGSVLLLPWWVLAVVAVAVALVAWRVRGRRRESNDNHDQLDADHPS